MATKLLSRIFRILKIPRKNIKIVYFRNIFPLKQNFHKSMQYVRWQWLMNMCIKFQVDVKKWLRYDIKHVENNQICPFSLFLFLTDFDFSKSVFGAFLCSLRKVDLTTCIVVPYHNFFRGVDLFYRMTLTCIMFKLNAKNCLRWSQRTYIPNFNPFVQRSWA